MSKTFEEYEKIISELKSENEYLRTVLKKHGIVFHVDRKAEDDKTSEKRKYSSDVQHARFFYSFFRGRYDAYAKRSINKKTGKKMYYLQCENFWIPAVCPKIDGEKVTCSECQNRRLKSLSPELLMDHLKGSDSYGNEFVIGVYPLFSDSTCYFLVFDFDDHEGTIDNKDWMEEVDTIRKICRLNDIPCLVERSGSGKGAHVWIFFDKPVPASVARKFGNALLDKGAESVNLKNFRYYDRMIPAQDSLPINKKTGVMGMGNLVALPLQGNALKDGNSAFVDENWIPYEDQWEALRETSKLDENFLNKKISEWKPLGEKNKHKSDPWDIRLGLFEQSDVLHKVTIHLYDYIYIDTFGMKPRMQNQIRSFASFSNPEFYKKYNAGFSTYNTPRIIYCGFDENQYICLPRGLKEKLLAGFDSSGISYEIVDHRISGSDIDVHFRGDLHTEQQSAIDSLKKHDDGIIAATTAFGKTVIGSYLISERKVNTLILVHNTAILKNWQEGLMNFLEINEDPPEYLTKGGKVKKRKSAIGTASGGNDKLTGIVDIAIYSSLGKGSELNEKIDKYGMVIMDECHHGPAESVTDVISKIRAKYIYGLTATPKRQDGMEKKMYMFFGPVRFEYTAKERNEKQGIEHFVYPRFTRAVSSVELNFNDALDFISKNTNRNEQILKDIYECVKDGRTPLVLTKRTDHANCIYDLLKNQADYVYLLTGQGSNKEKNYNLTAVKEVPDDRSLIIIATVNYIGEGFNCPRLDTLMLTMPVSWEGIVEQIAGRLSRDYDGKSEAIIYDYIDMHIPVLEKTYHKRLKAYKKIGYEICDNHHEIQKHKNVIFDKDTYKAIYDEDLNRANRIIYISSPLLSKNGVFAFIKQIASIQERGVNITVETLAPDCYKNDRKIEIAELIASLQRAGISVITLSSMYEHFSIIDDQVVWYGSMSLLSTIKVDDNIIRLNSNELAEELLIRKKLKTDLL